ncbi:MAG: hypothetical protein IKP73_04335 [Bacteroidales bacterium]|nr:hypothetical protein [Bacteroidales bacterium]
MKGKIIVAALILTFLSSCLDEGKETIIMEDEKVEMTGIYRAVPQHTVNALKEYMPIYEGDNPPNIEGCYLIKPMVAVYCEDGGYKPGDEVTETKIRFTNQNDSNGTIDYEDIEGSDRQVGKGAFVSGDGNNFTAYFDTDGETEGEYGTIKTTMALVISGTKTSSGISNIKYAFTMVKKVGDKDDELMEEGVYRVFKDKDGLAANSTWTHSKKTETSSNPLLNKSAKSN